MGNYFSDKTLIRNKSLEDKVNKPFSYRISKWFVFSNKKEKYGICKLCIEKSPCEHVFWDLNTGLKKYINADDIIDIIGNENFEIIHT